MKLLIWNIVEYSPAQELYPGALSRISCDITEGEFSDAVPVKLVPVRSVPPLSLSQAPKCLLLASDQVVNPQHGAVHLGFIFPEAAAGEVIFRS
ncbi:hypothetical protein [Sphingobacterium sp. T2]|uniref:hypothetical protein n=1 Tax=Sphingobacterium sp. T2 TaxID=1590596 RepID=UPI0012E01F34|nr:hypothetical protein [Sphingobacterium sp. T2]